MITTDLKSYKQYSEIMCDSRDLYAENYRTIMSHPGGERKAWPMRKLEAGAVQ
jgi:hypothetical protein